MSCCASDKSSDLTATMDVQSEGEVLDSVKEYYGKVLKTDKDLKTNACTGGMRMPKHIRDALSKVHDEVVTKYYGCGLVIPDSLEGCSVLDLGSGSGRDCYTVAQLVGAKGSVTGIDMTDEQLDVANKYKEYHRELFGYSENNVHFVKGYIEKLGEAGLKDNTFDVIISNCVVNLSPDKRAVLSEAFRVLKPGGELYFSDVYASKPVPKEVQENKVLWGECISGALYWDDLMKIAKEVGFTKPRLVTASHISIDNEKLQSIVGDIKFVSATYRLFKIPADVNYEATQGIYDGTITACEKGFVFDAQNEFKTGDVVKIDSDLATILRSTRFADDFSFQPTTDTDQSKAGCCLPTKENNADPFKFMEISDSCTTGGKCQLGGSCGSGGSKSCGSGGSKSCASGGNKSCGSDKSCGTGACGKKEDSCCKSKSSGCC
ncbi:arsenite methyltransferase-like [Saccoglossus kowalevskii]|uniref:Arsenite methyltransferase n=1 Tax=Saccoglossus kowalevskii TaxID=10224 RepID=A0ABM0GSP5_SACKO|nr:PREDICTED: arsenite methyltransferase-like [Saccoglossus kowalevskii]